MAPTELVWCDATELARLIRAGDVDATDVVQEHLDRMQQVGPLVNAFVTVQGEQALTASRSPKTGPLAGVPITVKDSFDTAGVRTTRGSLLFADDVPGADATAVARLRAAGAILLGKTNLPEMSFWTETDNLLVGRSLNPYDAERTPGGSSGGEAAAIAAGLSPLGLGSDVAISVRGPAHDTGIAALKPTHGRIPCTGHFPDCLRRWWHVGPMARSVRDLRLALSVLEGPDGIDPWAVSKPPPVGFRPTGGARVGWTISAFGPIDPDVASTVAAAADALADLGCRVEQVALPEVAERDHTSTSATLFGAEISPYLRQVAAERTEELHPVIRRVLDAQAPSLADYLAAEREVEQLRAAFATFFGSYDVLLCPVVTFPAPRHGERRHVVDGVDVPASAVMRATVPFNLTGLPAVCVPFGATATGLPVGVQLVGPWWSDVDVLGLAQRLEQMSPVLGRRPPL